ncbi:hypothetical protein K438DRAFT_1777446 [Mycena galopus ATCC 62051]|nr:hypothetical protein K438DRAFT_1777446 [Mycena galopus ATCC 62051]
MLLEGDMVGAHAKYVQLFADLQAVDNDLACLCVGKLADPVKFLHTDTEVLRWAVVFLAFTLRPSVRSPLAVHQALQRLGDVLARQGSDDAAWNILAVALEAFIWMDVHQNRAECMRTMGDIHLRRGDRYGAGEMWAAVRPLFECSEQMKEVAGIDERLHTPDIFSISV